MGAEKLWLFTLFSAALLSLLLLLLYSFSTFSNSSSKPFPSIIHHGAHYPPAFGYYISGGRGDKDRIFRLLLSTYHPRNRYLLHLGVDASEEERLRLVAAVMSVPAIRTFGNVDVEEKPDILSYMGSSNFAAILRAVAILLKVDKGWNWFVYLSAGDYPLVTQDGFGKQLQLPLWGLLLSCSIAFFFTLPVGVTQATTNLLVGTTVVLTVYFGTSWWMLTTVPHICHTNLLPEGSPWTYPRDDVFYNASII